eukprot:m.286061 g.286061  ORF g.286061 m.286061 type:complete len:200 (+) comp54981_c0_seq2:1053-1652(+)
MSAATDSIASLSSTLKFLLTIGRLKTEKRTGWVRSNVHLPESISDHMYRMALIAFACGSRSGVNTDKCIKMALVHDLAECVVGDITPDCGVTKEEKQQRELAAMRGLCEMLEPTVAQEFMSLFLEYEAGTSPGMLSSQSRSVCPDDQFFFPRTQTPCSSKTLTNLKWSCKPMSMSKRKSDPEDSRRSSGRQKERYAMHS